MKHYKVQLAILYPVIALLILFSAFATVKAAKYSTAFDMQVEVTLGVTEAAQYAIEGNYSRATEKAREAERLQEQVRMFVK